MLMAITLYCELPGTGSGRTPGHFCLKVIVPGNILPVSDRKKLASYLSNRNIDSQWCMRQMWVIHEYTIMTNIIDLRIQPPPHVMCFLSPPRREAGLRFDPKNSILKTSICPEFRHRFRMATLLSIYLFIYSLAQEVLRQLPLQVITNPYMNNINTGQKVRQVLMSPWVRRHVVCGSFFPAS